MMCLPRASGEFQANIPRQPPPLAAPSAAPEDTRAFSGRRHVNNRTALWTALALVLIVAAFLAGLLLFRGKEPPRAAPSPNTAVAQTGVPAPAAAAPAAPLEIRGVKDAYASKFPVGTAGDLAGFSDQELQIIRTNFNMLMAENCLKPGPIHPSEDTWNWAPADRLVEFAQTNGLQVIGHTLVWHSQTGAWMFQGADVGIGRDKVVARLKTHIQTLVGRYAGKIAVWNVANEAINDGGNAQTGPTENLRNSNWLRIVGPDYLTLAFQFAHEADPAAKLYYTDYDIEAGAKHQSSLVLLKRLLAQKTPITGVGIQGHWNLNNVPYAALEQAIADYQGLGLKVALSELDVAIGTSARAGVDMTDPLRAQADAYRRILKIALDHRAVVSHVVFYDLTDRRSWRSGQAPTLFDNTGQAKPAWQAVIDAAAGKELP
jgi:GH35 family endo-1,4-beta-xylanase